MGQAHSPDGLSSELDKRQVEGPTHSLDNLSTTLERARISDDIIQFMIIESLAICIFGSICGCQMVGMENRSRGVESRGIIY